MSPVHDPIGPNLVPDHIFDSQLTELARSAVIRISDDMSRHAPYMAREVSRWMNSLSWTGRAEDCFRDGRAHIMLLPWLAEKSLRTTPDLEFQSNLVYSSANAYYFIRFIDNLTDGHGGADVRLLPALAFFHTQFQSPYLLYFPHDSPFWEFFQTTWTSMAEATVKDAVQVEFSEADFARLAAQKRAGVKIPLAAVCFRCQRVEMLPLWCGFYDLLAHWHQMLDDLLDWRGDLEHGVSTFVLSEAKRCKRDDESVAGWLFREGFAWGLVVLEEWMRNLHMHARALNSVGLEAYLTHIEAQSGQLRNRLPEFKMLAELAHLLESPDPTE